jgi:dTDP-4-dehydrorhamnose reductase
MTVLITGAGGMLARALAVELRGRHQDVLPVDRGALDVTDRSAVLQAVTDSCAEIVVQCAAYTAVDAAETDEPMAMRVNADATRFLAEACQKTGALLVYPSTDYVFSGRSDRPYRPDDPVGPVNAYGRSKLAGEAAARTAGRFLIVRTSWLYGEGGKNFVDTVVSKADAGEQLRVVDDQIGRPTWTVTLSGAIGDLLDARAEGVFHVTDGGLPASWYEVAREVIALHGSAVPVVPIASVQVGHAARRAAYSVLDCSSTEDRIGRRLPSWRCSLRRYLESRRGAGSAVALPERC